MVDIAAKILTFRHPLLQDSKGYPKTIRRGVAKIKNPGKLTDDLKWLVDNAPVSQDQLPKEREFHPDSITFYFEALASQAPTEPPKPETQEERIERRWAKAGNGSGHWAFTLAKRDLEVQQLQNVIKGMQQTLAIRTEQQQTITIGECWTHFSEQTTCSTPEAKKNLLRRVEHIVDGLGRNVPHCSVTKSRIEEVIKEIKDISEPERLMIRQEAKRFFKELSHPIESDGLGLINPAIAIKTKGVKHGVVVTTDPRELMAIGMDEYWNCLAAVLGYAGLRLAEAAALTWDALDWKTKIIRIRATDVYPKLKSAMSERDIKPFPNLWPILEAYQKIARHKTIIFDRPGKAGPTWFREYQGKPRAMDLSGQFKTEIEEFSVKLAEKPALRLRHFWQTEMRAAGLGALIESMGGHEDKVGLAHYTKHERVVEASVIPKL